MKKWIALLAVLLMAFCVVGCGNSTKEIEPSATVESPASDTSEKLPELQIEEGVVDTENEEPEDIEIEEKPMEIELVEFRAEDTDEENYFRLFAKIHNISDSKIDGVSLGIQVLDTNGDVLFQRTNVCITHDLEVGQSGWSFGTQLDVPYDELCSIKIIRYELDEHITGNQYQLLYSRDFPEPIIITASDIPAVD